MSKGKEYVHAKIGELSKSRLQELAAYAGDSEASVMRQIIKLAWEKMKREDRR